MHGQGQSDGPIVPRKRPNNVRPLGTAEGVEGEGPAEGKPSQQNAPRMQSRTSVSSALDRIRRAARENKGLRFTSLLHHVYGMRSLMEAFGLLKREASAGVDKVTWREYRKGVLGRLSSLMDRLKRGGYRAKPVRRVYIPKADGRQRPLGVPALEDKLVQLSAVRVLNAIYEEDFLGFSYGFRPGRSQHDALDALAVGIERKRVNWVLDADIRGFFDAISHEWLVKFLEHRIADQRVIRLIQKWLNAGVLEDGERYRTEVGTPQGGSISPLLANIYLHYAFDLWANQWRQRYAQGDVIIVRYADDFVVGFQSKVDAERFLEELRDRLAKFGLELHPDKTRLIEFGRYAATNRRQRGEAKPETFDFLGLTHICGTDRRGRFQLVRRTMRKRLRAKLKEVSATLKRRRHEAVDRVGRWLGSVVTGHARYYGVPTNYQSLAEFRREALRLWRRALSTRSQRGRVSWDRLNRLARRFVPPVRIYHPWPSERLCVTT